MIHVCFGLHDKTGRFAKFTGTTILSLFENTNSKVTVHILHDNTLTTDNRDKFIYLAGCYGQRVNFYNVEEQCAEKIEEFVDLIPNARTSKVGIGSFYRLLITKVLPKDIEKIAYIDSDVIVNLDINEFWSIELGEKIFACVPELFNGVDTQKILPLCYEGYVKKEDYFNAGILLMNLKQFRNEEALLKKGLKFRGEHLYYFCFDQDILNYCFSTRTLQLPNKFNFLVREARKRSETKIERKIYHYLSSSVGWGILSDMSDPFNRLWMSYFIKTPWFDADAMGRFYAGVQQLHIELKQALIQLSALMSGNTRVFFTLPENVEATKEIFSVKPNEEIILFESEESLDKLINEMKNSRSEKVFFIMIMNFPFDILINAGFVYGQDFLDGMEFFSEAQGFPLNSYPFIKAM